MVIWSRLRRNRSEGGSWLVIQIIGALRAVKNKGIPQSDSWIRNKGRHRCVLGGLFVQQNDA